MSPRYPDQTKIGSKREDTRQQAVLQHVDEHGKAHVEELFELLRIPSVGAQPQHNADTKAAADWLSDNMRGAGLENESVHFAAPWKVDVADRLVEALESFRTKRALDQRLVEAVCDAANGRM